MVKLSTDSQSGFTAWLPVWPLASSLAASSRRPLLRAPVRNMTGAELRDGRWEIPAEALTRELEAGPSPPRRSLHARGRWKTYSERPNMALGGYVS
jgi:hypothetical protein